LPISVVLASIEECHPEGYLHLKKKLKRLRNNENEDRTNLLMLERDDWHNKKNINSRNITARKDVD
jgi:hypothetical protein